MKILHEQDNMRVTLDESGTVAIVNTRTGHKLQARAEGDAIRISPDVAFLGIHPELEHSSLLR